MLQEALNDLQALSIVENEGSRKKYKKGFVQSQQFVRQFFFLFLLYDMYCVSTREHNIPGELTGNIFPLALNKH